MATQTIPNEQVQLIPISSLVVSKDNPRKAFDDAALSELAASIKAHGVTSPALVRPVNGGGKFEVIYGERRLRASKLAGQEHLPVIIRTLTDEEAAELRLVENVQREALSAMEEALEYQKRYKGIAAADIAAKIGKPETHVVQRLRLLKLAEDAQKALSSGKILIGHALELCKYREDEQKQALRWLLSARVENGHGANWKEMATHYSVDALKRYLQATFMLILSSAPFDTADPSLNPKMGACTDCSYNTGNLGALFVGMKEARCTVPECFQIKTNKSLLNEIDAVGKETGKKVFRLGIGSEYQNRGLSKNMVDGYYHEHSREIVEVAVGKECEFTLPAVVTFVDPTLGIKSTPGKRLLICADEKCKTHRGESQRAGLAPRKGIELVDHKEKNLKISLGQRARTQAYQQLAIKLLAKPVIVLASAREESFAALLKYVQNHLYIDRFRDAGKAIGLERPAKREFGGPDWEKAVVKHFGDNRSALVLALVAAEGIQDSDRKNALYRIAAEHKVDVPKIEKSIAAEDKALIATARERAKEKSSGEPKAAKKASPKKSTPKKKVAKKT